jgi:hypothetical protein
MQPLFAQERIFCRRDFDSPFGYVDAKSARVRSLVLVATSNLKQPSVGGIGRPLQRPFAKQVAVHTTLRVWILADFQRCGSAAMA